MHLCDDYRSPLVLNHNLLGFGRTSDLTGLALALGGTLLVSSLVESDEQEEVGTQKTATEKSSTLTTSTVTNRRSSVLNSKVAVSCEENDEKVNDELSDLKGGEVLLPPDLGAAGSGVVVVVHDNVNSEVEGNDNPLDRGLAVELGVAEDSSSGVVEDMKESKRLLLEDEEDSVDELNVLEVVVDHVVSDQSRGEGRSAANRPEETVLEEKRNNFFKHQHEEKTRTEGKVDIVDLEGNLELERLSVLHHLSSSKDDQKISADSSDDGLLGAERRLSGNPGPVRERGLREVERVPSRGDGGIDGTGPGSPGVEGEHSEG